jgi:NitT/TauT family transport system substrate-binding protein
MRRDALGSSHASAIRHLIQSHFKALDHLMRSPQDAAYRMASHLNLPATGVLAAYKGLVLPNAANNFRLLAGKHSELLATAGRVSKLMFESGLLKQPDTLDELIRAEFLPTDDLLR